MPKTKPLARDSAEMAIKRDKMLEAGEIGLLRAMSGMNDKELAEASGVNYSTLRWRIRGGIPFPSDKLTRIRTACQEKILTELCGDKKEYSRVMRPWRAIVEARAGICED